MAYKLAEAYVQIVPSMKGVGKAIETAFDKSSTDAGTKGGQAAGSGFAGGLKAKMGVIIGAASAITTKAMNTITSSIGSAVSRADQMNNFPKVMKNLGYSSEDAAKSVKKISDSLDGLPTTSSAMTGMVQQLAPLTSNLDEATDIALAFNNAMLAGGASTMEQENALTQLTQMLAAGTVDMQAWRSVQAAMPGQLNQVAEAMLGQGKNANDLYDALKNGEVGLDDFNEAVVRLNRDGFGKYASFAQQAKDATQGIGTALENMQNRVAKAVQKVIEAVGVENIAGAINNFSSQFGKIGDKAAEAVTWTKTQFQSLGAQLTELGAFDTLRNAWQTLVDAFKGIDWNTLLPSAAFDQFRNLAASAIGLIIEKFSGLAGYVSGAIQWISDFSNAFSNTGVFQAWADVFGSVLDVFDTLFDAIGNLVGKLGELTGAANGASSIGETLGSIFRAAAETVKPLLDRLADLLYWCSNNSQAIITAVGAVGGGFAIFKGIPATLAGVGKGFDALTNGMKTVTDTAKNVQSAFELIKESGGLVSYLKEIHGGFNLVAKAQTAWSAVTKAATAVQAAFNAVLNANPLGLIVTAIAAVVAALVWFFTQTETGQRIWQGFVSWLGTAWQWLCDTASSIFSGLGQFFSSLWQGISSVAQTVWGAISGFFTTVWGGITAVWDGIWNGIRTVFEVVWTAIQAYYQNVIVPIAEFIKDCFIVLAAVWVTIWNGIKTAFETVWNAIVAFVTPIIEAIQTAIETFCTAVKTVWDAVWTAVSNFFQTVWNGIVSFFTPIINGIRTTITNVVNGIKSTWETVWNAIKSFFTTIWNGIVSFFTPIINGIRATITTVGNGIKSTWTSIWNSISSFFKGIWDGMKNTVGNAIGFIGNKVRGIKDTVMSALSGAGTWLRDTGRNLIQGLINGIGDMFGWVRDKICSLGANILGWAKGVLGIGSPSRIFAQYGRWLDEGLANGIADATGTVKTELDTMTRMVAATQFGFGDISTPSITPYDISPTMDDANAASRGANVHITNYYPQADPWPLVTNDELDNAVYGL